MEWELLGLFDWEHVFSILSVIFGVTTFAIYARIKTIAFPNKRCFPNDILIISDNIKINWLKVPVVRFVKKYLLFMKLTMICDDAAKSY